MCATNDFVRAPLRRSFSVRGATMRTMYLAQIVSNAWYPLQSNSRNLGSQRHGRHKAIRSIVEEDLIAHTKRNS